MLDEGYHRAKNISETLPVKETSCVIFIPDHDKGHDFSVLKYYEIEPVHATKPALLFPLPLCRCNTICLPARKRGAVNGVRQLLGKL